MWGWKFTHLSSPKLRENEYLKLDYFEVCEFIFCREFEFWS